MNQKLHIFSSTDKGRTHQHVPTRPCCAYGTAAAFKRPMRWLTARDINVSDAKAVLH